MSNPFASGSPSPPQAAPISLPPTMPDPISPETLASRRRGQQDIMGRAGRSSTILSTAMSRDGGGDYSASRLGTST